MDTLAWVIGFVAAVTIIGHGIWAACAWLIRQIASAWREGHAMSRSDAGTHLPVRSARRGPQHPVNIDDSLSDLAAAARQINRLHQTDAIDEETYRQVMHAVEAETRRHTKPTAAPPPISPAAPTRPEPRKPAETIPPTPEYQAPIDKVPTESSLGSGQ